jgi:uncharacterized protein YdeI (YjbR/CyaY-like superfamily)
VGEGLPIELFAGPAEFESWLEENHASSAGLWLKIAKKGSGERSVTHPEALELALAFGWIDSQRRGLDERYFLQRFTPRRPRGRWSRINREKAEALIEEGRMRPAGIAEVEAAKADGRWDRAYAGPASITVPDDLAAALAEHPGATEFFEQLNGTNRYAVLWRVHTAASPQTRAKRIATLAQMLAEGRTIH